MKNGESKVVRFNENDVIATSGAFKLIVGGTYEDQDLLDSSMYVKDSDPKEYITSGTIAGAAYNGTISSTGGFLYVGTEKIDLLSESSALTGYYTYNSGTNTYTWVGKTISQ